MIDKHQAGLYGKFIVARTDGKSEKGQKHDGCEHFVLDLDHDPFALPALRAYADACRGEYPALAKDLDAIVAGGRVNETLWTSHDEGAESDEECPGCGRLTNDDECSACDALLDDVDANTRGDIA